MTNRPSKMVPFTRKMKQIGPLICQGPPKHGPLKRKTLGKLRLGLRALSLHGPRRWATGRLVNGSRTDAMAAHPSSNDDVPSSVLNFFREWRIF